MNKCKETAILNFELIVWWKCFALQHVHVCFFVFMLWCFVYCCEPCNFGEVTNCKQCAELGINYTLPTWDERRQLHYSWWSWWFMCNVYFNISSLALAVSLLFNVMNYNVLLRHSPFWQYVKVVDMVFNIRIFVRQIFAGFAGVQLFV